MFLASSAQLLPERGEDFLRADLLADVEGETFQYSNSLGRWSLKYIMLIQSNKYHIYSLNITWRQHSWFPYQRHSSLFRRRLHIRKYAFSQRVFQDCNNLPQSTVEAETILAFNRRLDDERIKFLKTQIYQ